MCTQPTIGAPRTRFARSPETVLSTVDGPGRILSADMEAISHLDLTGTLLQPDKEKGCPPTIPLILTRTLTRPRISILFPLVFWFGRVLEWVTMDMFRVLHPINLVI